jgi:superfamily II DNA or RNA helicase
MNSSRAELPAMSELEETRYIPSRASILPPLRPYQVDMVEAALKVLLETEKGSTIQLPTGMGKTRILMEIVLRLISRDRNVRILFIVHSSSILNQTSDELINAGIGHTLLVSASNVTTQPEDNVTLAMGPTLDRRTRAGKLDMFEWDIIIIDEIHRLLGQHIRTAFKWGVPVIGATATPVRSDKRSIGEVTPFIIEGPTIKEGTKLGALVPQHTHRLPSPDLRKVKLRGSDYDAADLEREMLARNIYKAVVHYWERLAIDDGWSSKHEEVYQREVKKIVAAAQDNNAVKIHKNIKVGGVRRQRITMGFAPTVNASRTVVRAFNNAGYRFVHIDKDTDDKTKEKLLKALEAHKIDGIINVAMFVEGLDIKEISCVLDMAPTLSVSKFLQIPGRGLRQAPGTTKTTLKYLDFAGNTETHGDIDADRDWSKGGEVKEYEIDSKRVCGRCKVRVPVVSLKCHVCKIEHTAEELLEKHLHAKLERKYSRETKPRKAPQAVVDLVAKYPWAVIAWNKLEQERHSLGLPLPIRGKRVGYSETLLQKMIAKTEQAKEDKVKKIQAKKQSLSLVGDNWRVIHDKAESLASVAGELKKTSKQEANSSKNKLQVLLQQ